MRKPGKYRRFFIILFELFIVLMLYKMLHERTGLSFGLFFVLLFVLFWLINWLIGALTLGKNIQETLILKMFPRAQFSNDWFGVLTAAAILGGFFIGLLMPTVLVVLLLMALFGYYAYRLTMDRHNILRHSWGMVALGFFFGLLFGTDASSLPFVIVVFVVGFVAMYLSTAPDEL
ncbi:MAG: hypothetical protein ABIC95_05425 [archaeon]